MLLWTAQGRAARSTVPRPPPGRDLPIPNLKDETPMILVSRLNGQQLALNCDLIERAESNPDTVLTLVDGTKYVVAESLQEIVDKVREFRASVMALAGTMELRQTREHDAPVLRLLPSTEA